MGILNRNHPSRQHGAALSTGNVSVYIFFMLFTAWLVFQIWSRLGGGPPPVGLDQMVMAALGVAVAGKSVERGAQDKALESKVRQLEDVAITEHPESARRLDQLEKTGRTNKQEKKGKAHPNASSRLDRLEDDHNEQ